MFRRVALISISLFASILVASGHVGADERSEALDREATTMYQQVFSPFCPGRSLNDCPSSKATALKDEMRAKLETGVPPSEILKEVFATYGDQYRAVPPFAGVGALVWLVPIGFVVIGLLVALRVSIRRKRIESPSSGTAAMGTLSAEDERRIQEELSKLD